MSTTEKYEVIIIGGSYAGLSAAMALGRSLRKTLLIDSGKPCNQQTPHSHNFLTQDGKTPSEISAVSKEQVLAYPDVQLIEGLVQEGEKIDAGFEVKLGNGDSYIGKKLILATGIQDLIPEIKGFSACWGISVIHCPYCHGYEFRGKKTGLMSNGDKAFHMVSLIRNLTDQVSILPNGKSSFSPEQSQILEKHQIELLEKGILEIKHKHGYLKEVLFADGTRQTFDAVYASIPFRQSKLVEILGCELTEHGHIKVNEFQESSVEGIFACGDNSTPLRSVAQAVASGNFAGAYLNKVLVETEFT
ncbi:MAG: NAD(P)/FAD-dependent oxidoreductase [Bacteroidia bacterium]|nr:NAD(P)/FAD-dependent oxidoreductase [Bacteroidia bacterium]